MFVHPLLFVFKPEELAAAHCLLDLFGYSFQGATDVNDLSQMDELNDHISVVVEHSP